MSERQNRSNAAHFLQRLTARKDGKLTFQNSKSMNNTTHTHYVTTTTTGTTMGPISDMRDDHNHVFYGTEDECAIIATLRDLAGGYLANEASLASAIIKIESDGSTVNFETVEHGFIDGTINFPGNTWDDFYMTAATVDGNWSFGWGNGWGKTWRTEEVAND